jgi:transcriptional regulator with XRE-family HTH domain
MRKSRKELPPLCADVKRIRNEWGESQAAFAARIGVTVTTISRFERGTAEPSNRKVLIALHQAYVGKDMAPPPALIDKLRDDLNSTSQPGVTGPRLSTASFDPPVRSLREWRLFCALRVTLVHFPEAVAAIEKAASEALALVDEAITGADRIDYQQLERAAFELADKKMLNDLKGKGKEQEER